MQIKILIISLIDHLIGHNDAAKKR